VEYTPIVIDVESFYSRKDKYTISHLGTILYVRDPRFWVHGASIKVGDQPARWFTHENLASALDAIDWANTALIGHNLQFDALVLVEHYGHRPARYIDTLGLARAILRKPDLLILDEATSALDSQSERLVQEAIDRFEQNHTVLVIAHRLSTIVRAHNIVVMEEGRIVQSGTHSTMLSVHGMYRNLWEIQQNGLLPNARLS
jgi:ABC-type molybdate transport system ATPase subunit